MSNGFEDAAKIEPIQIKSLSGEAVGGNFYELVGGKETFRRLAAKFYEGVATDEVLKPMYPEHDLGPAAERLQLFLEQYWGGPTTYQEQRGHPRLRMRHHPYAIDPEARDHWLACMRVALSARTLSQEDDAEIWSYLVSSAFAMVNTMDLPGV